MFSNGEKLSLHSFSIFTSQSCSCVVVHVKKCMQFASNYKRRCLSSSFSRTVTRERRRGGALLMILTIKYSGPDGRVFGGTRDSEQRVSILFSLAARESSFFSSFFFSLMYAARAARRGKVVDVTWGCLKKKKKRKEKRRRARYFSDVIFYFLVILVFRSPRLSFFPSHPPSTSFPLCSLFSPFLFHRIFPLSVRRRV